MIFIALYTAYCFLISRPDRCFLFVPSRKHSFSLENPSVKYIFSPIDTLSHLKTSIKLELENPFKSDFDKKLYPTLKILKARFKRRILHVPNPNANERKQ